MAKWRGEPIESPCTVIGITPKECAADAFVTKKLIWSNISEVAQI
jgi:hypothetical protein